MAAGGKYNIDLLKIKHGAEDYGFDVGSKFFESFEGSTIKEGNIEVNIHLEKTGNTYDTLIEVDGTVRLECDRCLNLIDFPVKGNLDLVVKLVDGPGDNSDDEIVNVPMGEGVFNASQHIYDCIYLALPLRKTCEEAGIAEGCDNKVIEKLNRVDEGDDDGTGDPRWDKLKDLL